MRKELVINETAPESRAALLEDGRTVEVFHERRGREALVGNVYRGRVQRVLPGMQAAFVSLPLGVVERDAFLYVEDAIPRPVDLDFGESAEPRAASETEKPRIDDLVKEGQEILVQVAKDPMAGKGPRVTKNISLPGRLLVYLPFVPEVGISRRITDENERERLRRILEDFGGEGGFIARTAAQGAPPEEFAQDRRYLTDLAASIFTKAGEGGGPLLLHHELDLARRLARDVVTPDFAAIHVDEKAAHERLSEFLGATAPILVSRLELHESEETLFGRFGVEAEIEKALKSRVELASGGSIVIHQTEALVAIDINTGKFVGKADLEETVFATNREAIPEVARQIRLRDLGGLLVVDFIDMGDPGHRREIFELFEAELSRDRARTRILQISEFGLIEVTRQRSRGNLEKTLTRPCPDCGGSGRVKTDLTVALDLRRSLLNTPALYTAGETVRVRVRPSLSRFLSEEEPELLADAESKLKVRIELVPDETLPPAAYSIE